MAPILRLAVRESASRHAMAFQRSISGAFAAQRAPTAALGFVRAGPLPAIEGFCGGGAAAALRTASRSVSRRHALTRSRALVISASASASAGAGGAEPGKGSEPGAAPLEGPLPATNTRRVGLRPRQQPCRRPAAKTGPANSAVCITTKDCSCLCA